MKRYGLVVGALLLAFVSACGDPDKINGGHGAVGYSLVFSLKWQGPLDLDLELETPSGEEITFSNPSGDGCAFVSAEGGRPGPLTESVACTSLQPGLYQARVRNLELEAVPALLDISSDGVSVQTYSFTVAAEGLSDSYGVTVPAPTPTPRSS